MSTRPERRSSRFRMRALLAVLAVLAGLALLYASIMLVVRGPLRPPTPTPTPTPRPQIALDPTTGYAGTYITLTGRYWKPGGLVYIYLSPPREPAEAYAYKGSQVDSSGQFADALVFPDDSRFLNRGVVSIVVRSESGQEARAPFRVRPPTPIAPTPTPRPPTPTPTRTPPPPTPPATPAPTRAPTRTFEGWVGEYFDNPDLAGDPVLVRDDEGVDFVWGAGSPDAALPSDAFSARWSRTLEMAAGTYHFHIRSDDGCRLIVDGQTLIDQWHDSPEVAYTGDIYLSQGEHQIVAEYFEHFGTGAISLWWEYEGAFPNWKAEYFTNMNLSGSPLLTRDDDQVDFDWGDAAPDPSLPADGFSVLWTRKWYFLSGNHRFYAQARDGIRIWFDDKLVMDEWHTGTDTTYAGDVQIQDEGWHIVRIQYYHESGRAQVKVSWERLAAYLGWKGQYFSNEELRGQPVFVRDDPNVDFEWGLGVPGPGMPKEDFSVRWTREVEFTAGNYRFNAVADDGIRVWVDDWEVIDEWHDSIRQAYSADFEGLSAGRHIVRVEYYEHAGEATVKVWWSQLPTQQQKQAK